MMNTRNGARLALICLLLLCVGQAAVAADIDGTWIFLFETPIGVREVPTTITTDGEDVTAKTKSATLTGRFLDSRLALNGEVYVERVGYKAPFKIDVAYDGKGFKGNASWDTHEFPVTAKRSE